MLEISPLEQQLTAAVASWNVRSLLFSFSLLAVVVVCFFLFHFILLCIQSIFWSLLLLLLCGVCAVTVSPCIKTSTLNVTAKRSYHSSIILRFTLCRCWLDSTYNTLALTLSCSAFRAIVSLVCISNWTICAWYIYILLTDLIALSLSFFGLGALLFGKIEMYHFDGT